MSHWGDDFASIKPQVISTIRIVTHRNSLASPCPHRRRWGHNSCSPKVGVFLVCGTKGGKNHTLADSYLSVSHTSPSRSNTITMAKPRYLTETERAKVLEFQDMIHYSPRYNDDTHEYRHVMLPKNMLKAIPLDYFNADTGTLRILFEEEWRGLGITQSLGWVHYEIHAPEPHILLFKRPINYGQ